MGRGEKALPLRVPVLAKVPVAALSLRARLAQTRLHALRRNGNAAHAQHGDEGVPGYRAAIHDGAQALRQCYRLRFGVIDSMTADRLEELATLDPGDLPDDARVAITAGDLRDFVALARAALEPACELGSDAGGDEGANQGDEHDHPSPRR